MVRLRVVWGAMERGGKTLWTRVGLAWVSRSGAVFAQLHSIPSSGRICIDGSLTEVNAAAQVIEEVAR